MSDFDARAKTWDDDPDKIARSRALAAAIRDRVELRSSTRLFEYGAGTGQLALALAPHVATVMLADASAGMIAVARERLGAAGLDPDRAIQLDLLTDPAPDEEFDLVVSAMTLHHVPDIPALLTALHGLLASGGTIALSDLDAEDGSFHSHDHDFTGHNGFDRAALGTQARAAGFTDIAFSTPLEVTKEVDGVARAFPLFLLTARRG
ncbi:MAG: class I SAM-dependent methyltransferase [Tetrasphaera sp.]